MKRIKCGMRAFVSVAALALVLGAGSVDDARAAGKPACDPTIQAPRDGDFAWSSLEVVWDLGLDGDCHVKKMRIDVWNIQGGQKTKVYSKTLQRSKGGLAAQGPLETWQHKIPIRVIAENTRYRVTINQFHPKKFLEGDDPTVGTHNDSHTFVYHGGLRATVVFDSRFLDGGSDYAIEGARGVHYLDADIGRVGRLPVTRQDNDTINGHTARGRVVEGVDGVHVRGRIARLDIESPSSVRLYTTQEDHAAIYGPEIPTPSDLLLLDGSSTDGGSSYAIESGGRAIAISGRIGDTDVTREGDRLADGKVANGADGYILKEPLAKVNVADPAAVDLRMNGHPAHLVIIDGHDQPGTTTYQFTVDHGVRRIHETALGRAVSVQDDDRIKDGRRVQGRVAGGADAYLVIGSIGPEDIDLDDPLSAAIVIDGERYDIDAQDVADAAESEVPENLANGGSGFDRDPVGNPGAGQKPGETLIIDGRSGPRRLVTYEVVTDGTVTQVDGRLEGVRVSKDVDKIRNGEISGRVKNGADGFEVADGRVISVNLSGYAAADVLIDGNRVPEHTLVIDGRSAPDLATDYTVEVGYGIKQVAGVLDGRQVTRDRDTVKARRVHGRVGPGGDGFRFLGQLDSLKLKNPKAAEVYVDGQRVQP